MSTSSPATPATPVDVSPGERSERLERAAYLMALPVALVPAVVVAVLLHPLVGLVAAVVLALAWTLEVRRRILHADVRVLGPLAASRLEPGAQPRLENLVDGLCSTNGVAPPTLCLIGSDGANAAVVAVDERVTIVVTSGLVDALDRLELEGVVANLVARVRDGSAAHTALVLSLLGDSPPARRRLAVALGEQRAVRSDLAAVELTRYPPGLRSALETIDRVGTRVDAPPLSRLSWIAPPGGSPQDTADPALESNEQPLALRAAVLGEL